MDNVSREPLTMHRAAIVRRVDALFRAMSSDFLLREQFITDPAQILSEYVYATKMPPDEASLTNHLIYSIMSSRGLLNWFRDRAFQPHNQMQSDGSFVAEFSHAVVQHGNHNLVHSLIRHSAVSAKVMAFDGLQLSEIIRTVLSSESGTEQSPGGGGTQQSGTHTTEHSTGGGGTRGWVLNSLFGDSYAKVTLEALFQYASNLEKLGMLDMSRE